MAELASAVGKWWFFTWVAIILAGLVALTLTVTNAADLPPATWATLLGAGLLLAPAVAFHTLRLERDTYLALWSDKEAVISVLGSLEDLRKEAAALHIRGMSRPSVRTVNKWVREVDDWTERAIHTAGLLHPAEAGNLTTLGVFRVQLASGTKPFNAKHLNALRNFVRRMEILSEIRERWAISAAR